MYGKVFESMYTGSMRGAGLHVFGAMTYAIANADEKGYVELNPEVMGFLMGADTKTMNEAIDYLCQPDPNSRSKDEEGRRLLREGQFLYRIVNHGRYREMRDREERRRYQREWDRKNRPSGHKRTQSDTVRHSPTNPTQAEADVDVDSPPHNPPKGTIAREFDEDFWPNVPNKIAKGAARRAYEKARKKATREAILAGLPSYRQYEAKRAAQDDYRPLHPATWLNGERWLDEPGDNGDTKTAGQRWMEAHADDED